MNVYPQEHLEMLELAREFARLSECRKMKFGCVILDQDRSLVGQGFNHSIRPEGCCLRVGVPSGTRLERCYAVHAEQAAILSMDIPSWRKHDLTAYVAGYFPDGSEYEDTGFSCTLCVRLLKEAGVSQIVFPDSTQEHGYRVQSIESGIDTAYGVAAGERQAYSKGV